MSLKKRERGLRNSGEGPGVEQHRVPLLLHQHTGSLYGAFLGSRCLHF